MKDSPYKWGRVVSRRLFRTQAYSETVDDYFRSITDKPKRRTKPILCLAEALYGIDTSLKIQVENKLPKEFVKVLRR